MSKGNSSARPLQGTLLMRQEALMDRTINLHRGSGQAKKDTTW